MAFGIQEKLSYTKIYLFESVSAAPVGLFRILWGIVMGFHFYKLAFISGKAMYIDTIFHFKYPFFEWIETLPPSGMMALFYLGLVASLFMALGFYYKTTAKVLFFVYTFVFLQDVSYWNNHYYAYMLINGFFMFTDAHKAFSVDKIRLELDTYIPRWQLLLFQFQIMVIYFYGGMSKLQNKDWMENVSGYTLIKNNLSWKKEYIYPVSLVVTYGGLLYDLTIPFLLKWRKAVLWCFPFILLFNVSNLFLFNIGTFPYAMIASFVLFVPTGLVYKLVQKRQAAAHFSIKTKPFQKKIIVFSLTIFVLFQLLFPFRSWLIQGNVFWTGEGKLFSWHMMSASNKTKSNEFLIVEYDDSGNFLKETPLNAATYLSKKQLRTMTSLPKMIPQFAKFIQQESELAGFKNTVILAQFYTSKNFRAPQLMVDPSIDLSTLEVFHYKHNPWILLYDSERGYFKN